MLFLIWVYSIKCSKQGKQNKGKARKDMIIMTNEKTILNSMSKEQQAKAIQSMRNKIAKRLVRELLKDNGYTQQDIDQAKVVHKDNNHLIVDLSSERYIEIVSFVKHNEQWVITTDDTGNFKESKELEPLINESLKITNDYLISSSLD